MIKFSGSYLKKNPFHLQWNFLLVMLQKFREVINCGWQNLRSSLLLWKFLTFSQGEAQKWQVRSLNLNHMSCYKKLLRDWSLYWTLCSPERSALQLLVNRDKTMPALIIVHVFSNLFKGCVTRSWPCLGHSSATLGRVGRLCKGALWRYCLKCTLWSSPSVEIFKHRHLSATVREIT